MVQSCSQPITDRLVLTDMNMAHNVFIAGVLCQEGVQIAVHCALRVKAFVFCCILSI
jgi:hypothetical protein